MIQKFLIIDNEIDTKEMLINSLDTSQSDILQIDFDENAVTFAQKINPDMFIIGLQDHWQNGIEFCKKIRARSSTPILILSAYDKPEIVTKFLDAGADDYLIRPVKQKVLIAHIKRIMKRVAKQVNN